LEIYKEFTLEAAHRLPRVPEGHKCGRLHGHSFKVAVHVAGPLDEHGFVMDYARIAEAFEPLHEELDHNYLNEVPGLENPTTEELARWIWKRLRPALPELCRLVLNETCTSGCIYTGD
jgi:6-pyruvoyltetrahydropterin/6-carboxytetrahydropterin synthase